MTLSRAVALGAGPSLLAYGLWALRSGHLGTLRAPPYLTFISDLFASLAGDPGE